MVNWSLDGTALGVDLVNGRFLVPKRSRLQDMVSALTWLLAERRSSPKQFGHFFGAIQFPTDLALVSCLLATLVVDLRAE